MQIKRKFIMLAIFIAMIISLFPGMEAKADSSDVNIISKSQVTADQAKSWAKSRGATDTFVSLAELYFKYYSDHGNVNPAIAYAQAAKETNFGNFGGVLDESFHNPCGLKIAAGGSDTDKDAHIRFDNWDQGVQAHLDHLALYAGADGYPRDNTYDQRQFRTIKGVAPTVESLDGKWAPSVTYGDEINSLYQEMILHSGASTVTGWTKSNGSWYYYNQDHKMATGWIKPDNNWYYLYGDGTMATGWIKSGEAWYYLKSSGAMAAGSWITYNGSAYYLDQSGKMLTNTKINGFNIGADGRREGGNGQIIAIDAGHDYGSDGGAVYTINGVTYKEVDLNIQIAAKLKDELEKKGYTVVMTRDEGETPNYGSLSSSLAHRVDTANNTNANLFISIHHNAVDGIPTAEGVETYYSVHPKDAAYGGDLDSDKIEKSKEIAQAINDKIANEIGANNRGIKSDANAAVGSLFVLRNTKMPGILIEVGFISNAEEAARCADPNSQQKIAEAIAEGVSENLH
ncbi:N-acetylmuramoyl-L-alanine amidase [Clostridium sp. BL-8]|uniref:N-acetylmuramoyl-L-alanine amidase n=1 Tax=Clostridium sp. BL-8 TaxID=349938 RepID=UPI00098CAEA0|nr:N-acetylmuramoyl-L-alanine amidase [Clostridium sp. BL-8]